MSRYKNPKTHDFESLSEFLLKVRQLREKGIDDTRFKTLTETTDSAGGVTVPEQFADELWYAALEAGIVRPRATIVQMKTDVVRVPTLVESSRAASLFGGITFKWLDELGDKFTGESTPSLGQVGLVAKKGVASCIVSNELMADAQAFEAFFKTAFGQAAAFYEDDVYVNGSGVGRPLGVMASGALVTVTRAANGHIDGADFGAMAERLLPRSWDNAIWMTSPGGLKDIIQLTAAAANQMSVLNLADMKILGRPLVISEKCAALGTTGDIILADWKGYVIGDRDMYIDMSPHVPNYFEADKSLWKVVLRIDGQPVINSPLTPANGGSTVSHFVALSTNS